VNQPLAVVLTIIPVARSIRIVLHWLPVATNEAIPSGASTSSTGRKAFTRLSRCAMSRVRSRMARGTDPVRPVAKRKATRPRLAARMTVIFTSTDGQNS